MMIGNNANTRLSRIDQHIAQTEHRVTQQAERIEQLRANGYNTNHSTELLCTLQETLCVLKDYRHTLEGLINLRREMRRF